jgi:hypothetical protein
MTKERNKLPHTTVPSEKQSHHSYLSDEKFPTSRLTEVIPIAPEVSKVHRLRVPSQQTLGPKIGQVRVSDDHCNSLRRTGAW